MSENSEEKNRRDNETGEEEEGKPVTETTNAETGEPEGIPKRFQVPRGCLQQHQDKVGRKSTKPRKKTVYGFYWRKQEIRSNVVKEFAICKRRRVSPIVFVLPSLFICPAWATLLWLLGEACMHIWSHRRNSKRKNANVEYRSPFHVISSHFCIHCRYQKWKEKISQIQDKRNLRRRLIYPNLRTRGIRLHRQTN